MAQVTIYMDNHLEEKIKKTAKETGVSISKFISKVLEKNLETNWGNDIKSLSGSWDDISMDDIKQTQAKDYKRELF